MFANIQIRNLPVAVGTGLVINYWIKYFAKKASTKKTTTPEPTPIDFTRINDLAFPWNPKQ